MPTLQSVIAADHAAIAADTGAFGVSVLCTTETGGYSVTVGATVRVPDAELMEAQRGVEMVQTTAFDLPRATVSAAFGRDIASEDTITYDGSVYAVQRTAPDVSIIRCYCMLTTLQRAASDGTRLAKES